MKFPEVQAPILEQTDTDATKDMLWDLKKKLFTVFIPAHASFSFGTLLH